MKNQILDAFMIFSISRDLLDNCFTDSFGMFRKYVNRYFDGDMEFAASIILMDAAHDIRLGISYGIYDKEVAKYYRIK